jgi:hypothetical protein
MLTIKDFKLGRMYFPTLEDALAESVGDGLEAVGAGLAAGERKPRPMDLTIPVSASSKEANPYADGDRMRRQVRSLMENPAARLSGLYMIVAFDPELNGWALIGGGKLEYDTGGVAFADYKLTLSDSYVVGKRRTHRPARRVAAFDRRLITTPRDYEGQVFSTSFASSPAVVQVALPHGATDARARSIASAQQVRSLATADGGSANIYSGLVNGDVLSFEQPESAEGLGDVVIYDRRGVAAPAELMTVKEPQATFGWEEVYGPDYPLTEGDPPVMQNGICRMRYLAAPAPCFALDQFSGGAWVEQARIAPAVTGVAATALISCTVKAWTPEQAVVFCRFACGATNTVDIYYILQRGWAGPRIETYGRPSTGSQRAEIWYYPQDANGMLFAKADAMSVSTEAWAASVLWAENVEPWAVLAPLTGGGIHHRFAVGNVTGVTAVVLSSTTTYYGGTRKGLQFRGTTSSTTATGWCGVNIALGGAEGVRIFEAETYRNAAGTTSEIVDVLASAEKAVEETQALETNPTLQEPLGGTAIGLLAGTSYGIWARVKAVTAGGTASVRAQIGGALGSIKTTTATAYIWVYLGPITKPLAGSRFQVNEWRSVGTGNTRIDRLIVLPLEVATDDGVLDLGAASLYDARAVPELVSR